MHKYLDGKEWPYLRESDYDHTGEGDGVGFNVNIPLNVVSIYQIKKHRKCNVLL